MLKQKFEVQRSGNQVHVARQSGDVPHPQPGEALLQMVACGICGADVRVVTKNKEASGIPESYITLGHESVGRVISLNSNAELQAGDYAVILPHIHKDRSTSGCPLPHVNPVCIGSGHTLHMGWDIDGCFANFMRVPVSNLVHVAPHHLLLATRQAPYLREAIFAFVEPMLCALSAYEMIENHLHEELPPGRALVIGCGPIGILHSLILLERGFEVWLMDTVQKRAELAQWCIDYHGHVLPQGEQQEEFDLVMVTASSADAIRTGEKLVREGGVIYLFAGLNTTDRLAMNYEKIFFYEPVHRQGQMIKTSLHQAGKSKSLVYMGHSGYFEHLASQAVATVAINAAALDKAVTGIIPGLASTRIISRLPGGIDWISEDEAPAIVSILKGMDLRERHCKILIRTDEEHLLS